MDLPGVEALQVPGYILHFFPYLLIFSESCCGV
jgi:hypothetical protein